MNVIHLNLFGSFLYIHGQNHSFLFKALSHYSMNVSDKTQQAAVSKLVFAGLK